MSESLEGVVVKSTGSWYQVRNAEGGYVEARIKGKFRIQGIKTTNPIAVGDRVHYRFEEDGRAVIHEISDRKNYIIRKSVNLSKQAHIVASNVDQALLIVTISQPVTTTGFIDRFLISAEAYHIPVVLVFNKTDIYSTSDFAELDYLTSVYEKIGYPCHQVSAVTGQGLPELRKLLTHKVTLLSGHSGSGKSSLINAIAPEVAARVGDISDAHQKGKHTTTFAEMFPLSFGGDIIDTPGIKGFGLVDIDKHELARYFKEMYTLLPECKFHNCEHINEPKCAVQAAIDEEKIAPFRYKNYLAMYYDKDASTY
jgi:ribosome biogenesis GTPase / thiamine phosphate phosphatase